MSAKYSRDLLDRLKRADGRLSDNDCRRILDCIGMAELLEACKIMHQMLVERGCKNLAGTNLGENAIAKADADIPFSTPSLEPSYNELELEKQRRKRR